MVARDPESLDGPDATGVQHVDQPAVHGDARRELSARGDHRFEVEAITVDAERRDGIAAGVHREEQTTRRVVDERSLRGKVVRLGARRGDATQPASRVGAGPRQAPIDSSVIDDDMISGRFVGLHPDHRGRRRRGGVDCEEGGAN